MKREPFSREAITSRPGADGMFTTTRSCSAPAGIAMSAPVRRWTSYKTSASVAPWARMLSRFECTPTLSVGRCGSGVGILPVTPRSVMTRADRGEATTEFTTSSAGIWCPGNTEGLVCRAVRKAAGEGMGAAMANFTGAVETGLRSICAVIAGVAGACACTGTAAFGWPSLITMLLPEGTT